MTKPTNPSDFDLSNRTAELVAFITIVTSDKLAAKQKLNSGLTTYGEVAQLMSKPFVDDMLPAEEYQKLNADEKRDQDMVAGSWLPGHTKDQSYNNYPSGFSQSYLVYDLINCEPGEIDNIRTNGLGHIHLAFVIHTLRGHTALKPKIRVIFPLFEPISLLDACFIQPEVAEEIFFGVKLTGRVIGECLFEADRPLALPSISEGDAFWFQVGGQVPIYADYFINIIMGE